MDILGLSCAFAFYTTPSLVAQNWQQWQQQNPTYPGGLPTQQQPVRPSSGPRRSEPSASPEANQSCLADYRIYLQQAQTQIRQDMPSLHQNIVTMTHEYNDCLGSESRQPSGRPNPCSNSHRRLLSAQEQLQVQTREMDLIQADLALMARNPQQALSTLPCSGRWLTASRAGAFSSPCFCR